MERKRDGEREREREGGKKNEWVGYNKIRTCYKITSGPMCPKIHDFFMILVEKHFL